MTPFSSVVSGVSQTENGFAATIPQTWMQGRTTFGGLTSALAYQAVTQAVDDLPPLRTAQIAFLGPAGGDVVIKPEVLRRGKSVTAVGVDLSAESKLAARCTFVFGASRPTTISEHLTRMPGVPGPDQGFNISAVPGVPSFLRQFDAVIVGGAGPGTGSDVAEATYWLRHKDPLASDMAALIAIGDVPPPAYWSRFSKLSSSSSVNWHIDLQTSAPTTDDGWWLMRTAAEYYDEGYSSQHMTVWNRRGEPVMIGRQTVAIFE